MDRVALNIKDRETDRLAAEVAAMAGESKARAVKVALEERRARLEKRGAAREARLQRFLEEEIWPHVPPEELDQPPLTREEEDEILGYGPEGF